MNKIIFPLKLGMKNPAVGDLQAALQLLLGRGLILANEDPGDLRKLMMLLRRERGMRLYGDGTVSVVNAFQEERQLQPGGEIDEATAGALNALLSELGMLDPIETTSSNRVVSGETEIRNGVRHD